MIATFDTYADAESAVDYLSDQHFTVDKLAIVGRDIELVEQIVGRLNYGWAALCGAAAGALTGALFGWIFGLLDWVQPLLTGLALAFYGLVFGAVVGALLGLLMYALQGGRRDFTPFPVLTTMSLHNHGTPKSSPTSKSRTKPSADSPAGPIERNESWQLR
nr:general stress protein [Rhodococcus rhodochrous]